MDRQRDTDIDPSDTQRSAGRPPSRGSPLSWLVFAEPGRERILDTIGVSTVSIGSTFVRMLRELRPVLVVVASPPAATIELLAAVTERRRRPALRLIFLNDPADGAARLDALALGFDDALPITIDPLELAGRARLLLAGGASGSGNARRVPIARDVLLDLVGRRVQRRGTEVHLRPKEFDLLALLATDPGRVFTRAELIAGVWGAGYAGGDRTVDVHIRWIRAKLEENPARPAHVVTVRGAGYRFDPPAPLINP